MYLVWVWLQPFLKFTYRPCPEKSPLLFWMPLFPLWFLLLPWAEDELHLVSQGGPQQKIAALLAWKRRDGTFSLFSAIFYCRMSICASTCSVGRLPPPGRAFQCCKVRAEEEQAALLMLRLVLLFHLTQGYLTFSTVVTALPFGKKSSQVSPWCFHATFLISFDSRIKYHHFLAGRSSTTPWHSH